MELVEGAKIGKKSLVGSRQSLIGKEAHLLSEID